MMKMNQNTILVTGGTSGIGKALAAQLLKRDNIVLITGRSQQRLAEALAALPGAHGFVCDQSDPAAIVQLHGAVTAAFPTLNILVNNAGIGLKRNLNDTTVSLEELEREIRANLVGPIQLIQQFLPQLKRQGDAAIVNVTSGLAFAPLAPKPLYSATKAALHSYTMALRVQLSQSSVKVFELAPPGTATNFNRGQEDMNVGRRMSADDVAEAAIAGMQRGKEEILPGAASLLRLVGRVFPRAVLMAKVGKQMGAPGSQADQ